MSIASEFVKQIVLMLFYIIIIVLAIKLGISFAKKKNLKNAKESLE